jgi:uncharacterized protein (TIGR03067 family)
MRRCALLLVLALSSLAFAPAPLPRPPKKAAEPSWLGEWLQNNSPRVTLEVTPTSLTYHNAGGPPSAYGLTFDDKKAPKTYDLLRGGNVAFVGIYKVEGDTLTLCYRGVGQPRPTSFDKGGGTIEIFTKKKR